MSDNIIQPKVTRVDDLLPEGLAGFVAGKVTDPMMNMGNYPVTMARDPRLYDWYQFTHVVYDVDDDLSPLADACKTILLTALEKSGRRLDRLFKIRIVNSLPGTQERAQPHIDIVGPHQTGIWFPFDSDGTTDVMFERSWLQTWDTPETFSVAESLEARANTWYDFDGTHWRYTGRPDKFDSRYCVVFNFVALPK